MGSVPDQDKRHDAAGLAAKATGMPIRTAAYECAHGSACRRAPPDIERKRRHSRRVLAGQAGGLFLGVDVTPEGR
jgi:hypothetical protein